MNLGALRGSGVAVVAFAAAMLLAAPAAAHTDSPRGAPAATPKAPPPGPHGRLQARPADGGDVVRLVPTEGGQLAGAIEVTNVGDGPLTVRRVGFVAGSEGAPRTPLGASATLDKARATRLAPGEKRTIEVRWRSDASRAMELVGLVEVESDSAPRDGVSFDPSALVGVVADRRPGLGRVLAGTLALSPLLVLLLALSSGRVRVLGERALARASAAVFLAHAALAGIAVAWLDPRFATSDGNDGMQFIEHAALPGGLAWSVAIDGAAAPFLVASSLVILAAAAAGRRVRLHARRFFAGLGLLATSTSGALLALDVRLLVGFLLLAAPAAYLLVGASDDPRARRAATGVGALVLASTAVLAAALLGLAAAAGSGLDLARGRVDATWQIADLGRTAFEGSPRLLGLPAATAAWVLTVAGLLLRVAALSPITGGALRVAPPAATTALLGTALAPAGLLLARIGHGPGAASAGTVAAPLFAIGLLIGAAAVIDALRTTDLVRVAGSTVFLQLGLALAALGSRTPQGIEGALSILAWHGLAASLLLLVAAALRDRVGTSDGARLGGVGTDMPRAATLSGLASLAAGGLPGLAGFWGPGLAIVGLLARAPLVALAASVLLVAQAAALARVHARIFRGPQPSSWSASKELEPHGGRFPDLRARELLGLTPLAAALIVLGLHPRLLLAPSEARALEMHRRVDPAGPTQIACGGGATPGATRRG